MTERLYRVQPVNYLIKIQIVMVVVIVVVVGVWQGVDVALAYLYGGSILVLNTLLQRHHLIAAAKQAQSDASMNLRKAYRCVIERWILTIVLFVIGFLVLKLLPLPLITGFILTQFALLFGHFSRAET